MHERARPTWASSTAPRTSRAAGTSRAAALLRALAAAPLLACASACAIVPDPDLRNPVVPTSPPLVDEAAIEVVAELPIPPGNVTVSPGGRVFFTFHPEAHPDRHLAELLPDGRVEPFPDAAWQREREDGPYFVAPLALHADSTGRLWVLDHGDYGDSTPSLSAFDVETRALVHRYEFPSDVANWGSLLNDFAVDERHGAIYIADTSPYDFDPALIVYEIAEQRARRVLEDHESVDYEGQQLVVQNRFLTMFGIAIRIGADSIALSTDGADLLYGPLTGTRLYRVPVEALLDATLDDDALALLVAVFAPKPATDGIAVGPDGSVYLTAIEHDAVAVARPGESAPATLARSARLLAWPDGVAVSPDGAFLYATASELHHVIGFDADEIASHAPFRILRIPLPR